jgi:hypothetical protein
LFCRMLATRTGVHLRHENALVNDQGICFCRSQTKRKSNECFAVSTSACPEFMTT